MVDCQISIKIGNSAVHQGDFVFGDTAGVAVVPKDMTMDALVAAEGKEVAELILEKR
jgi:regulator of RNase E activity RraA